MTYPGGRVLTYEMDAIGRTAGLRTGASDYFVSAASYAAHGVDPDVRRGPWCVVAAWAAN